MNMILTPMVNIYQNLDSFIQSQSVLWLYVEKHSLGTTL